MHLSRERRYLDLLRNCCGFVKSLRICCRLVDHISYLQHAEVFRICCKGVRFVVDLLRICCGCVVRTQQFDKKSTTDRGSGVWP